MIRVTHATSVDFHELIRNLRPADRAELMASLGHTDPVRLWAAVGTHGVYAAHDANGDLVACFGCAQHTLQREVGVPWLLGTNLLFAYPKALHKLSKAHLAKWQQRWPILTNQTDKRNTLVLLWLQRLGFKFVGVSPGAADPSVPFIQFVRNSHV